MTPRLSLHPGRQIKAGFSILEVLVATAVLAGLALLLAGIIDGVSKATRSSILKTDASAQARIALNQMGRDLSTLATEGGATLVIGRSPSPTGINDSLAFLCSGRGRNTETNHRLLAVFYAVRNYSDSVLGVSSSTLPMLGRGFGSVPWQNTTGTAITEAFLDNACAKVAADINGSGGIATNKAVIGDGLIRMAVSLQLKSGKIIPCDPANADFPVDASFARPGVSLPSDARALDLSKVSAIIVGVAALDQKTRALSVADLADIADKLPRPAVGQAPIQAWDFTDSTFAASFNDVPLPVRQSIRFFQRTFTIP